VQVVKQEAVVIEKYGDVKCGCRRRARRIPSSRRLLLLEKIVTRK